MRIVVFILLALAVIAAPTAAKAEDAWGDKLFKVGDQSTTHDFGTVAHGARLHYQFKIANIYAVPLELVSVRVSCGCVTATPSTTVLKSRDTAVLDVTMDASRFVGQKTVSIFVTVGPEYTSTATLQVTATSRADVVFNPGQVTFGVVPAGQTATQTVDVEYAGTLNWKVQEVIKPAGYEAEATELYRRPGQQVGYRIKVTLKPDAPVGTQKVELQLKTNDPASPLVPLLVEATVQAALKAMPNPLQLGTLKVGESISKIVLVQANKPFRITSIEGLDDDVTVDLPSAAEKIQRLTFKYHPSKASEFHRQVVIKTDLEGEGTVAITLDGAAQP